nr:hypothetical protein [Tanacetum cinerariifolium]
MADLAFAPQQNMVSYLEKTEANAEFHQIVNFLTSSSIHHALTIHATVDGKIVVITESSVRIDLLFTDDNGITCLTNAQIFKNLPLMSLVRAATTASLDTQQDNSNIAKTQSKTTLNEPDPQGEGLGSGPGCQETMRGAMAQIRPEGAPIQSSDPPLSTGNTVRSEKDIMEYAIELMDPVPQTPHDSSLLGGHTPGSDEGSMTLKELTYMCTTLSQKVLDLEKVKTAQAKEITSLKKRVTKLEQTQSSRILGFHPFRDGTSRRHSLGRRNVSKQERKNLKSQQKFQDIDDLVDEGGSTSESVSTARPDISTARLKVSTAEPKTPPTTTTLFDDEDVTIADTLVMMKSQKAKEKGVAFKDVNDSARPIRSITTLQPLSTIDPKDKDLDEEVKTKRERQEEASKAALAELYDEVQAQIDVDLELAARLTHEEQEKYTVEERSKLLTEFFEKEEETVLKKMKRELEVKRKKQQVVPDDDKAINHKTLDVKSLIVDCESQVLGTMEAGDVHVYKLTRLDGSYKHFLTFSRMLEVLDRQDVLDLHKIVMEMFPANDPEGYDLILWGDLKTLMESSKDDEIWRNQQDWKLLS